MFMPWVASTAHDKIMQRGGGGGGQLGWKYGPAYVCVCVCVCRGGGGVDKSASILCKCLS